MATHLRSSSTRDHRFSTVKKIQPIVKIIQPILLDFFLLTVRKRIAEMKRVIAGERGLSTGEKSCSFGIMSVIALLFESPATQSTSHCVSHRFNRDIQ